MANRSALRALHAAELRNKILRLHAQKRMSLRQVAREMRLPVREVREVIELARRDAALERLDLGEESLEAELLRLLMIKRATGRLIHRECPVCGGAAAGCAACAGTGYRHPVSERLEAMERYLDAIALEDQLIGPVRRAAAGGWPPMELPKRFRNALGETTREDLEDIFDAHAAATYDHFASRALAGKITRYPRLAAKIRDDLARSRDGGTTAPGQADDGPSDSD
jgi:hypothetical protein